MTTKQSKIVDPQKNKINFKLSSRDFIYSLVLASKIIRHANKEEV